MSITFVKTYEIAEFKELVKTTSIRIFKNPQGAGYFRYLENNVTEKVFPLTSRAEIVETIADPVISLALKDKDDSNEKEILYIMHPRSSGGHELMGTL